jgi:glycosyltransferase involved in cell wall biosynthesis
MVDGSFSVTATGSGPILVLYWGRRGLSRFTLEVARAMGPSTLVSAARSNELHGAFAAEFGGRLLSVETFTASSGALLGAWRLPGLRRQLAQFLAERRVAAVIDLMPHVWMPAVLPVIRAASVPYVALAHDADVHPGDWRTRLAKRPIDHCLGRADAVIALSRAVADRVLATGAVRDDRLSILFHPHFDLATPRPERRGGRPLHLGFLGRIMPYKGLPLFVDMLERLQAEGLAVTAGVYGEGPLGQQEARLGALGAEIVNRWLDDAEMAEILGRCDVVVASHVEASQSGVVAAALGAGLPVIVTPVGGLVEQVEDGTTGLVASAAEPEALAAAVRRLAETPGLYAAMRAAIARKGDERSMGRFAQDLRDIVARLPASRG